MWQVGPRRGRREIWNELIRLLGRQLFERFRNNVLRQIDFESDRAYDQLRYRATRWLEGHINELPSSVRGYTDRIARQFTAYFLGNQLPAEADDNFDWFPNAEEANSMARQAGYYVRDRFHRGKSFHN